MKNIRLLPILYLMLFTSCTAENIPAGFVDIQHLDPSIKVELRYLGNDNFVGSQIDGYHSNTAYLTSQAAVQLAKVQSEIADFGLGLLIYDTYRPQRAVDHFIRWADTADETKKAKYYPEHEKPALFELGYIATRSGHSRGSTVDLTLISLDSGETLDMGSEWDYFGSKSGSYYPELSVEQRANRALLSAVMTKHGFVPYIEEWWHFRLAEEPFPDTYFDFEIR